MSVLRVGIVDLGEHLGPLVSSLLKELNTRQSSFHFEKAQTITAAVMGEPDVDNEWYDKPRLLELIESKVDSKNFDFLVAITDAKITVESEKTGKPDRDYFSYSNKKSIAVISVSPKVFNHSSPGTEVTQYAAFLIIFELIVMYTNKELSHFNPEPCLFNECEDRDFIGDCIDTGKICATCLGKLKERNVPDEMIDDAHKLMKWTSRRTTSNALVKPFKNPIVTIVLGAGIGWLLKTSVGQQYAVWVILVAVTPLLIVFARDRFMPRNWRMRR